jgi:hypothetical protein
VSNFSLHNAGIWRSLAGVRSINEHIERFVGT